MKHSLPENSKEHEARIKEISDMIVSAAKDKIAFVILFGSFARGTWVRDRYVEEGVIYEYASDYDFLIITKTTKQGTGSAAFDLERKVERAVKEAGLIYHAHNPHYIIEPLERVNDELEKSQYFFYDIKKEGVLLYDCGEFQLSEPKKLNKEAREKIAKADYDYWMNSAVDFIDSFKHSFSNERLSKSAFYLHQATESLYSCCLLTLTGYKPKSHDLKELNHLCSIYSNDFLTIFPLATEKQKECFKLLQKAYIDARYNKHYAITKEQLEYLISRVEKLKDLVEGVCGK